MRRECLEDNFEIELAARICIFAYDTQFLDCASFDCRQRYEHIYEVHVGLHNRQAIFTAEYAVL